jgi:hypothetical protein
METGPVLDPHDFVARYLSHPHPNAAAMGPEGAILCHVLYAWAVSYGADERGQLDVPDGGGAPLGPLSLVAPGENEMRRESDRQRRFHRMKAVVEMVLREIDECGIMRKPSWDGVTALLVILPLTEGGLRILIFFSRSDSEVLIRCRDIQFPPEAVDVRGGVEPGILALLILWCGV